MDNFGCDSSSIKIWQSNDLFNHSLNLSGSVGGANDIKMSKPIRPAYVIFNHKRSFFEQKTRKCYKKRINKNIYIVYSLSPKTISSNNALKNCLFGATKATKSGDTTDPDKYIYSGYGLRFDSTGQFTDTQGGI